MIALHIFNAKEIRAIRISQPAHGGNWNDPDRMQINAIRAYKTSPSEAGTFFAEESGPEWFRPVDFDRWMCLAQRGELFGLRRCKAVADSTLHLRCPLESVFVNSFNSKIGEKYWSSNYGQGRHWIEIQFQKPAVLSSLAIAWKGHPQEYAVSVESGSGKRMEIFHSRKQEKLDILRPAGSRSAINSIAAWEKQRTVIKHNILKIMHPFPTEKCPPDVEEIGRKRLKEGVAIEFAYSPEPWHRLHAYLALPKNGRPPYPLVVYTMYNRDKALDRARPFIERGFAVFAPDILVDHGRIPKGHPYTLQLPIMRRLYGASGDFRENHSSFAIGPRKWATRPDWHKKVRWSAMGKIIWDVARGLDVVLARPEIDPERVGCTGFSWGCAHTMYITAFEDRIKVASPQCGAYASSRLTRVVGNTSATWYNLPELSRYFREDSVSKIPFDRHELMALTAPRPMFIVEETRGSPWVMKSVQEVQKIYRLYGAEERFVARSPNDAHSYYLEGVDWFEKWLCPGKTAAKNL